jgi:hypothetical protein
VHAGIGIAAPSGVKSGQEAQIRQGRRICRMAGSLTRRLAAKYERSGRGLPKGSSQMRIKIFGSLVVTMALIVVMAAPTSAMAEAENATFQLAETSEPLPNGSRMKMFSDNFTFTTREGTETRFECDEAEIHGELVNNGVLPEIKVDKARFAGGGGKDPKSEYEMCRSEGGRYEARVRSVTFRGGRVEFFTDRVKGETSGFNFAEVRFVIDVWDRSINGSAPIAICNYEVELESEYQLNQPITRSNNPDQVSGTAHLEKSSSASCGKSGDVSAGFGITTGSDELVEVIMK